MNKFYIKCPLCDEKLKVIVDDSGNPTVFFVDKKHISIKSISKKYGIELGIDDKEVNGNGS